MTSAVINGTVLLAGLSATGPEAKRIDATYMMAGVDSDGVPRLLQLNADGTIGGSGGAPSGVAGGDLGGTYPNPTVKFQQAGANTVQRRQQDKSREIVSVKDFGAVGDGVTDDTAAFQAAFVYLRTSVSVPSLFIPAGTYLTTTSLNANGISGLEIYGDGVGRSIISGTLAVAKPVLDCMGSASATLRDFTVQANSTASCGVLFARDGNTGVGDQPYLDNMLINAPGSLVGIAIISADLSTINHTWSYGKTALFLGASDVLGVTSAYGTFGGATGNTLHVILGGGLIAHALGSGPCIRYDAGAAFASYGTYFALNGAGTEYIRISGTGGKHVYIVGGRGEAPGSATNTSVLNVTSTSTAGAISGDFEVKGVGPVITVAGGNAISDYDLNIVLSDPTNITYFSSAIVRGCRVHNTQNLLATVTDNSWNNIVSHQGTLDWFANCRTAGNANIQQSETVNYIDHISLSASDIPNLDASKITSGVIDAARLGIGTPTASKVLFGSGAWGTTITGDSGAVTFQFANPLWAAIAFSPVGGSATAYMGATSSGVLVTGANDGDMIIRSENKRILFSVDGGASVAAKFSGTQATIAGSLAVGTASGAPTAVTFSIPIAPTATANAGLISLGSGAFDGTTSGFYAGNSNGTHIAVNAASGYLGRMLDLQIAGVRVMGVGRTTVASGASVTLNAIDMPDNTVTITGSTNITTAAGFNYVTIGIPTYTAGSALTVTNSATLVIAGAPVAAGSATLTNKYAFWVQGGISKFDGNIAIPASSGSTTAPTIYDSTTPGTGITIGNNSFGFSAQGTINVLMRGPGSIDFANSILIRWSSAANANGATDLSLARLGAANLRIGAAASATPVANTLTIGEASRGGTDTNVAGANGTIQSGLGTGNATGSSLIFQTPTAGSTGTTAQSYATRLTINEVSATFVPPILLPDGSTSAVAIGRSAATNTGLIFSSGAVQVVVGGTKAVWLGLSAGTGVQVPSTGGFTFGSGADPSGASDLALLRDAANVLAQRNSTNAQAFRLYNTYTDASNYERFNIGALGTINSLTNRIGLYFTHLGTGAGRNVDFGTDASASVSLITNGVHRWFVDPNGHFGGVTDNTYDVGASGASRPRNVYIGTDIYTGNAAFMHRTSAPLTGGATGNTPTLTTGPVTGNPTKWIPIDDNGTTRYIPAW